MLKQKLSQSQPQNIEIEFIEVKESTGEVIDELREGVESFLGVVIVSEVFFLSMVTMGLLFTSPFLSPVGFVFITHLICHYQQKLRKLREDIQG